MKELEKTQRISISTVLFILVIIIGILTFKKPTNVYEKSAKDTLAMLGTQEYLVPISEVDPTNTVLIDVRDKFEYSKSHIDNAYNIPTADILKETSISIFEELKDAGKDIVFYGKNPDEANSAWMILYQLGYENIKILNNQTELVDNNFKITPYDVEKPIPDYMDVFKKGNPENSNGLEHMAPETTKKVIVIKKKKKRKPEGGC